MATSNGRRWALLSAGVLALATLAQPAAAQAGSGSTFVSFNAFLADTSQASYTRAAAQRRTGAVRSAAAFDEMRTYVLRTYAGVQVNHSYYDNDSYFDCVAVMSQPTVRALGIKQLATPPPASVVEPATAAARTSGPAGADGAEVQGAASQLMLGLVDRFGNDLSCQAGTIPMQRLSLDRLTRFASLADFLAKTPDGAASSATDGARVQTTHEWAYGRQYVNNHGGQSVLQLWNPSANFSLSQHWYGTGSGASTQTVEGGWIKYPTKFGSRSVTFIYYTPDNYTTGCYNLDCVGFVQTNQNWTLGGAWSTYSTLGGTQYGFTMQWQLFQGNWWLYLKGSGAMEAVGYYPGNLYNGGSLATQATRASYGGEVADSAGVFPDMGSGRFASEGFGWAALQRNVWYISTGQVSTWTSLATTETSPSCYTIDYTSSANGGSWGTYFYFGGPGGAGC